MSQPEDETHLAERHYVTLIVRMMVNDHGQLISGEMLDTASNFHERFVGDSALVEMVRRWLIAHQEQARQEAPRTSLEPRS